MDADRPLADVTVVVARPADRAAALVDLVEARGARALVVPLVEIVEPVDPGRLEAVLADLRSFDWIVVTSPNAAARVAPFLATTPHVRVAAVGSSTAGALPRTDLIADRQSAEGLVAVFPDGPGRVLVAQAAAGAPTLVDGLAGKGWTVERVHTHDTRPVRPAAREQLAVLRADVVLLTSGSQARSWVEAFGDAAPPVVGAIGPQTARDAEVAGLKVDFVATDHSLVGLVDALQAFWMQQ
jgi:uroporphyrinogen-III synthase